MYGGFILKSDAMAIGLLAGTGILFFIQLYYLVFLSSIKKYLKKIGNKEIELPQEKPSISVIIPVLSESLHLRDLLSGVAEQDYPLYEVIIVHDNSSEEISQPVSEFENKYNRIRSCIIPSNTLGLDPKKLAITIGIKAARYDHFLLTEAYCIPSDKHWISSMARHFDNRTHLVLGFTSLKLDQPGGVAARYAVFDNLFTGLQYLSFSLKGKPYMGIGCNLAYSKELFFKHKGFSKQLNLQIGEDDLFVGAVADKENTAVELSSESIVFSYLENIDRWKEIRMGREKSRSYYKKQPVLFWRFELISRLLFYIFGCTLIVYAWGAWITVLTVLSLFIFRSVIQLYVINSLAEKLKVRKFYLTLPFFDILQPFIEIHFNLCSRLKKKNQYNVWK